MEEKLNLNLEKGEKLLWSGTPEKYETMDAVYKPAFVKSCVVGLVVFAVLSALYFWGLSKYEASMKVWLLAVFALLAAFKPVSYFTDAAKLRKTVYAVTDKRLLIINEDVRELPLNMLNAAEIKADEAGMKTLLCGTPSLKLKSAKWREAALFARIESEHEDENRYAFYAVEDAEGLKAALASYVNL